MKILTLKQKNLLAINPAKRSNTPFLISTLLAFLLLFNSMKVNAQVVTASPGDYRSNGTGTWENAANWQRYVGGIVAGWVTSTTAPDSYSWSDYHQKSTCGYI